MRSDVRSHVHYNHYSTARTIEQALGLAPLTANDGYAPPINDAFVAGVVTEPTLSLSSYSVTEGQNVVATYSTPPGTLSSTNWVGLYQAGQTPGVVASTTYQYAPNASGTLTFATSGLSPGDYSLFYLYNNGYTVLAGPVGLTVTATAQQQALLACRGHADQRLSVTTTNPTEARGRGQYQNGPQCP